MNPDLSLLQPYPFERLAELNACVVPPADLQPIPLSIGEPKHTTPAFIAETIAATFEARCSNAAPNPRRVASSIGQPRLTSTKSAPRCSAISVLM